jgi:amidase
LLEHGQRVTTDRLRELEHMTAAWSSELDHLLSDVDAFVCPVSAYPNPPLGNSGAPPSPEAIANSVYYTAPFNFSGHPALTLPMGFVDGAPSGFQLIGRSHDEAGLIELGLRIQEAQPWSDHPTGFD